MYILSCYDVKDVHCSIFSKNFHLHKMYYISGSGVDRRGEGGERSNLQQQLLSCHTFRTATYHNVYLAKKHWEYQRK